MWLNLISVIALLVVNSVQYIIIDKQKITIAINQIQINILFDLGVKKNFCVSLYLPVHIFKQIIMEPFTLGNDCHRTSTDLSNKKNIYITDRVVLSKN